MLSDLDWGSVPAWVGSVLSSGSLILGVFILYLNRRDAVEKQARQITYRTERDGRLTEDGLEERSLTIFVRNGSDSPISSIVLMATPYSLKKIRGLSKEGSGRYDEFLAASSKRTDLEELRDYGKLIPHWIYPEKSADHTGEQERELEKEGRATLRFSTPFYFEWYRLILTFSDAAGRNWAWDLHTRTLLRGPR